MKNPQHTGNSACFSAIKTPQRASENRAAGNGRVAHSWQPDIQSETDRYIVNPGQALAYKLGQLKFLELRKRAQDELGPKYDVRAFHDEMLNGGVLPLDLLDSRTNSWIHTQKASVRTAAN